MAQASRKARLYCAGRYGFQSELDSHSLVGCRVAAHQLSLSLVILKLVANLDGLAQAGNPPAAILVVGPVGTQARQQLHAERVLTMREPLLERPRRVRMRKRVDIRAFSHARTSRLQL